MLPLYYFAFQGRNWARLIIIISTVLGVLSLPWHPVTPFLADPYRAAIFLVQTILQLVAVVLLLLPGARRWFRVRVS